MDIAHYGRNHFLTLINCRPTHFAIAQSAGTIEYTDKGMLPPHECPDYDLKQSDGEVPMMLELWGMQSTPS